MRIVLITGGTRGDIQPFLALTLGLREAGHEVRIATHSDFAAWVGQYGIPFSPICGNFSDLLQSDLGREWIESAESFSRYKKASQALFGPLAQSWLDQQVEAIGDAELIITHPMIAGPTHWAEKHGIPLIIASLVPFTETGAYNIFTRDHFLLRGPINRFLWKQQFKLGWEIFAIPHASYRKELGLEPLVGGSVWTHRAWLRTPTVNLLSQCLVPHAADLPSHVSTTGFCFLPEDETEAHGRERASDFLRAGAPPLYVGFGSMTGYAPQKLLDLTVSAVRKQKQRAIIVSGWSGASVEDSDDILCLSEVDHAWLFPQVRAVVHHGGAGTLAAGLRAGRPTATVAFFGDQPFWGYRAEAAGVATRPIAKSKLTEERLSRAIERLVGDETLRHRAEAMGRTLRAEDGVGAAVGMIAHNGGTR